MPKKTGGRKIKIVKKSKPQRRLTRDVTKKAEFETYKLWFALPAFLRGQPPEVIKKFNINEKIAVELLEIPDQQSFAKKYKVSEEILSQWNKRIDASPGETVEATRAFARRLSTSSIGLVYRKLMQDGDAARARVVLETAGVLRSEAKVEVGGKAIEELAEGIKKLANKK